MGKWGELDVFARRISGLKDKLVCHFKLAVDIIGNGVTEFVYDVDGPKSLSKLYSSLQTCVR